MRPPHLELDSDRYRRSGIQLYRSFGRDWMVRGGGVAASLPFDATPGQLRAFAAKYGIEWQADAFLSLLSEQEKGMWAKASWMPTLLLPLRWATESGEPNEEDRGEFRTIQCGDVQTAEMVLALLNGNPEISALRAEVADLREANDRQARAILEFTAEFGPCKKEGGA